MGFGADKEQAEFNMAVSYLNRLNNLFYLCNNASIDRNIDLWFHSLNAIFRELSTEMNPKERDEWKEKQRGINTMISEMQRRNTRTGKQSIPPEIYEILQDYELFVRKVLKDSGMLMKMKTSAGLAMY